MPPQMGLQLTVDNGCFSNWKHTSRQCPQDVPSSSWSDYHTYELSCQLEMIFTNKKKKKEIVPKPE